jgi:phosphoglycolate phosphatase-like HAD superfamily hydrolase
MRPLNPATIIFDCDGVVLNSNRIKTEAFYQAALPYGEIAAHALVDYHVANGGISRYQKFAYFIKNLLPSNAIGPSLTKLLRPFEMLVRKGLLTCEVAADLTVLRQRTPSTRWLIVSGGDQSELREVFTQRRLEALFDGGIYGSPDDKRTIVSREIDEGNIAMPALLLGDSRLDHEVAAEFGFDFIFVSQWTEFKEWKQYCEEHLITTIAQPADLLQCIHYSPPSE